MKHIVLLSLLALGCVLVHGAPVEQAALEQGSCEDAQVKFTAGLALNKINQDRSEGYILSLHRVSNVHMKTHVSHTTTEQRNLSALLMRHNFLLSGLML